MNAPFNSDSQVYSAAETGQPTPPPSSYSPSVPISVYRELATELKTTQTTLDALTQQNQQLLRQNTLLRTEILRFLQSAEQLGHFAGVMPPEPTTVQSTPDEPVGTRSTAAPTDLFQPPSPEPQQAHANNFATESQAGSAAPTSTSDPSLKRRDHPQPSTPSSAIVPHPKKKRDRSNPADPSKQRLFTEQADEGRPLSKVASRSDLGNLWLATTILLVVVSAFGAGFLIMRPLLNR